MAEHSMCQPGRPGPISVSQTGSPSLGAFHRAKSWTLSFSYSSDSIRPAIRALVRSSAGSILDSRP